MSACCCVSSYVLLRQCNTAACRVWVADCGGAAVKLQAAAVLGEIAAVDPAEYERQQNASGEKAGVRSVAAFVKEMAAQLPR